MMIKRLSHSFFSTLVKIGQVVILLQNKPKFYTPLTEIEFILVLRLTKSESKGGGGGKETQKEKEESWTRKAVATMLIKILFPTLTPQTHFLLEMICKIPAIVSETNHFIYVKNRGTILGEVLR